MTSSGAQKWTIGNVPLIPPDVLSGIISTLADFAMVTDRRGLIVSILANPFLGKLTELRGWESTDVRDQLTVESVAKYERALADHLAKPDLPRSSELNHRDRKTGREFPVSYTFHAIGDGLILMMGRDLRPIADLQQQLVNAQLAVEKDFERQRGFDTRFRVLMQATRDPMLFVSVASGEIEMSNGAATSLLGKSREELRGRNFADFVEAQGHGELMASLAATALAEGPSVARLALRSGNRQVVVHPVFFRAAGERMLLCHFILDDEATVDGDAFATRLTDLFDRGPDAVVMTDADGRIETANAAFFDLAEADDAEAVRRRPLGEFLERGTVDQKILVDSALRAGRIKVYRTRVRGKFGAMRQVEISATHLGQDDRHELAFVIRDIEVSDLAQPVAGATGETAKANGSVAELVGSTKLRDIVSDSTEVIERICIETALEMTSNNRVAAAEMLGLSRQSLYVKLRKFGLL